MAITKPTKIPMPASFASLCNHIAALRHGLMAVAEDVDDKLPLAQGVENAGKFLVVGVDGNVTAQSLEVWEGGNY